MWDRIVVYEGRYVSNQESILEIPQSELKGTQRLNYLPPLVSWQLASDWIPRNVFTLNLEAQVPTLVRSTSGTAVLYQNSSRASM